MIMVVVDRFTKVAHFHFDAERHCEISITYVIKLHGFPDEIVSNRDTRFNSMVWQTLQTFSVPNYILALQTILKVKDKLNELFRLSTYFFDLAV